MTEATGKPIIENADLQELFKVLRDNESPSVNELLAVVKQISAVEKHLQAAVDNLAAMRLQLADMEARNHPVQSTLEGSVITMQNHVLHLRDRVMELKNNFIEGCKNAITAFKEQGISALDDVVKFLHIKPALELLRQDLDKTIKSDEKTIAKIEVAAAEYHEAGRHFKNVGRIIMGKEAIQEAKPIGPLAKALTAPYRAERKCFAAMKGCTEKAIGSLAWLEDRAKPSIQGTIQKYSDQISEETKSIPTPQLAISHDSR